MTKNLINFVKMNKFGEHIHRLRKEQNLTLLTLAERVGIDAAVLSKIENGHRVPLSLIHI